MGVGIVDAGEREGARAVDEGGGSRGDRDSDQRATSLLGLALLGRGVGSRRLGGTGEGAAGAGAEMRSRLCVSKASFILKPWIVVRGALRRRCDFK